MGTVHAGRDDLDRAAAALASRLPSPLAGLARLAYDYRWSWALDGDELFAAVDAERWERCGHNPVRLLQEAPPGAVARAAGDEALLARAAALEDRFREERDAPPAPDG